MNLSRLNSKPVFWYTLGSILRQLAAFIMLPIYTQYLTPAEYGIIGLLAMILGIYELFLGARFGAALPKFYYDTESISQKKILIFSALAVTSLASLFGGIIFATSANYLASDFFERADLAFAISLYGFMLITSAIEEYVLVLFRLRDKPFYFFISSLFKLILQLSLNVYFLVELGFGVEGVIFGNLIASVVLAVITGLYAINFSGIRFDLNVVKSLVQFAWPIWLAGLAAIYIKFTTNVLIKYFTSLEEIGIYHFAMKFSMLLTLFFWRPYNQWWQVERFRVSGNSSFPKLEFSASFVLIASVLMMAVMGIGLFSGIVIDLMANEAFQAARGVVPILCFLAMFENMHLFINFPFYKTGKTGYFPKIKAVKAVFVTIFVAIGAYLWGLEGAIYTLLILSICEFSVVQKIGKKQYDQGVPIVWFYFMSIFTFLYLNLTIYIVDIEKGYVYEFLAYTIACLGYLIISLVLLFVLSKKGREVIRFIKREF